MNALRDMLIRCRAQFERYGREHRGKEDKARAADRHLAGNMKHIAGNTAAQKAETNEKFVSDIDAVLALPEEASHDVLRLDKVADYRFGSLVKGRHYAFARGLTINPQHLPAALDAMQADGYHLLAIFGATDSEKMGFVFKIEDVGV